MNAVVNVAIAELPNIIELFQAMFANQHPTDPIPTNEEVMEAFETAFQSSRAKDDAWLKAHPKQP